MKEVTHEDWLRNPTPRMMWVWDDKAENKMKRKVIYLIEKENTSSPVVTLSWDGNIAVNFKHCAEIEESRRMTNKELSRWLREKPTREYKYKNGDNYIYSYYEYKEQYADEEVDDDIILIREDDSDWREPLVEIEE